MPRIARTVVAGCAHHITQRGNNRQAVFFVDDDRRVYLELLQEQAEKYGVKIAGYCLMDNHVHLVAIPPAEDSLAHAVGRTHFRYSQYINRFHRRSGHLWQGRFYSCALDARHFWLALRYVELNPVRARRCRRPWRYEWSSAAAHTDERAGSELLDLSDWYEQISAQAWRKELSRVLNDAELGQMRRRTHTGRPLGSDRFLSKLEARLGRRLRALPPGRPRTGKAPASRP
jgi:putative transposase